MKITNMNRKLKFLLITILLMCYVVFMCNVYLQTALNFVPSYDPKIVNWKSLLIDTPGYQLPDYDPFDKSILSILQPVPHNYDCSQGRRPLTSGSSNYTTKDADEEMKSVLVYHKDHLRDYNTAFAYCCFRSISRNDSDPLFPDTIYNFDKICHPIRKDITVIHDKAIMVTCSSDGVEIYKNVHFFVHQKDVKRNENVYKSDRPLSVMVFGIDAISRLNMERYMPKTIKVLKSNDAIDLRGLNKVGENTFPNMVSFLTGYFKGHWDNLKGEEMGYPFFDGYPFIWKNFSQVGYTTIFGEDCLSLGLFHYLTVKRGFKVPPTEYYLHPYFHAAEETVGWNGNLAWLAGCQKTCIGPNSSLKTLMKYAADLSQILTNVPYFSFMWSAALTHDRLPFAGLADDPSATFISEMIQGNFWNNTLVLFMSDHGILYGPIRKTYLGHIEANLPFGFLLLPQWFKESHPNAYDNLVYNQNRLVSPFDLRETLLDVSQGRYKDAHYVNSEYDSSNLPSKISLFRKVPGTRTCMDALIPIHFCSGVHATDVADDPKAFLSLKYLLADMNDVLDAYPECHKYIDFNMKRAFKISMFQYANQTHYDLDPVYYEIQWETLPGAALMEAVVEISKISNSSTEYKFSLQSTVSRLNSYEGQSNCVNEKDPELRKFCLCKSLVPV